MNTVQFRTSGETYLGPPERALRVQVAYSLIVLDLLLFHRVPS